MWPCYRLSRQNAVFERFLGRSRSHRVIENYMFDTQKNMFMKHPKSAQTPRQGAYALPARRLQKNENLRFVRELHHFLWPRSRISRDPAARRRSGNLTGKRSREGYSGVREA